jgi:hypothetical protein
VHFDHVAVQHGPTFHSTTVALDDANMKAGVHRARRADFLT